MDFFLAGWKRCGCQPAGPRRLQDDVRLLQERVAPLLAIGRGHAGAGKQEGQGGDCHPTHVADNRRLYQALFRSSAGSVVRTRFRRVVAGILLHFTEQAGSLTVLPAPPDMVCSLIAEMIVGAAVWWLEANADYDPALLAEIVVRLSEAGLFGLNGQEPVESDLSYRPFRFP